MLCYYQHQIENLQPCVATVGIFDGVHVGHRYLIEQVKEIAKKNNQPSVVITFKTHPRSIIQKEFKPQLLTSLEEKLSLFEKLGVDIAIILDFTTEMAQLTAYEFLKVFLKEKFNVQTLVVGHDHRFGHNRAESIVDYKQFGNRLNMEIIHSSRFTTAQDKQISSSEIRNALQNGDIELANRLLNYSFSIKGKVVGGYKVGRKIGFPTANIEPVCIQKIIPNVGVYAVQVKIDNEIFKGMLNIGYRPTIDNGKKISIEVHIIDFNKDVYNQLIEIVFIKKIRDEQKFQGVEELIAQLEKDKKNVIENF